MSEYVITCPLCGKRYKLTPKDPSTLVNKSFSCPRCRYTTSFLTLIKDLPAAQPVTYSEPPAPHAKPQIPHGMTKVATDARTQDKAYLSVLGSNSKFILNPGFYILGRKSSDSPATLQLAPDISMSRQHARLSVHFVGGKLKAQIVGLKANNPIFINGKMCAAGQPCMLKSGDKLQLGSTRVIFTI